MRSLLLAGGKSQRMGQDKALIKIDGKAMITRVVEALKKAGREPIRIAVANPEKMEEYAEVIGPDYDIEWVLDSVQYAGPVNSIIDNLNDPICLEQDTVQLATVDVPWITHEVFSSLENSMSKDDEVIIPTDGDLLQPLISLIRPRLLLDSLENWDSSPLHVLFLKIPHSLLMVDHVLIKNVNTEFDL